MLSNVSGERTGGDPLHGRNGEEERLGQLANESFQEGGNLVAREQIHIQLLTFSNDKE